MPKPRIEPIWSDRARAIYAAAPADEKPSAKAIFEELGGNNVGYEGPSERWIRRDIKEFRALPELEQAEFALFEWPKSMKSGLLPWEASRALLDLIAELRESMSDRRAYLWVTVEQARWYWRAYQAMPDARWDEIRYVAGMLLAASMAPVAPHPDSVLSMEWYLAYAPWRSDEAQARYDDAIEAGRIWGLSFGPNLRNASQHLRSAVSEAQKGDINMSHRAEGGLEPVWVFGRLRQMQNYMRPIIWKEDLNDE